MSFFEGTLFKEKPQGSHPFCRQSLMDEFFVLASVIVFAASNKKY